MRIKYQSKSKESHLVVGKKILRYLIGIFNIDLWYSRYSSIDLVWYSDVDFIDC